MVIKRSVTIGKIRKSLIHKIEYFTTESHVQMLTIWPVKRRINVSAKTPRDFTMLSTKQLHCPPLSELLNLQLMMIKIALTK